MSKMLKNCNLLTLDDKDEWNKLVDSCGQADIHFTAQYLEMFEKKMGGQAMLFVVHDEETKNFLLYPFFLRRINDLEYFSSLKDNYFDIVSPWYFGGPLFYHGKSTAKLINTFFEGFNEYAEQKGIITEFTRIFPFFETSKNFISLTKADYMYDISYVDLNQTVDTIWKNFKKSNRNAINAAKRKGVQVEFASSNNALKGFYDLYQKTMERTGASEFYSFSSDFFEKMMDILRNNVIVVTAKHDNNIVSSSVLLFKYGIIHYWLSGSDYQFRHLNANNLLLYESMRWAKNNGNNTFVLMGGTNVGLRAFKESFTNTTIGFYTSSKIYNNEIFS
ncbi:MAG: GNAT family N-acetyltransferase, partial [Patescibacteria group bacterium]|nr:GNAT family N-acetyltransferase [Patescibacteria group bacterium]